ncbi:MAG: hypothetical protein R3D98_12115, partial [Candidatus Krumholzibacteriia bacterium]
GRRLVAALLALATALAACGCAVGDPTDPDPAGGDPDRSAGYVVVTGADYTLPAWVAAETFGGYVGHPDGAAAGIGSSYRNWWTTWAELEPERGRYDWDLIERRLAAAEDRGDRLCLQIQSMVCGGGDPERGFVVPNAVPDWVFTELGLTDDDRIGLGGEWDIEVIPAWRPEIRDAFNALILAIGERGYPAREALGAAYIHAISPSLGEEFWLEPWQTHVLESRAGFSAAVMQEWLESRMDAYATAFGADVRKVAWVGSISIWGYSGQDYKAAAWALVEHAWSLGAGNRSSIVEKYHIGLDDPALGQSLDQDGYLYTDETIPPLAEARYFGDENEEYGDQWTWRYGDTAGDWQRYRFAMLRAMQMQVRFLWTHEPGEAIDPALSHYARFAFGKTVQTTPDAWCYLKESAVARILTPAGVVRNFERWLRQRDVPGGLTVATDRVDRAFNAGSILDSEEGAFYDYTARRTDLAGGQDAMYFDVDDRFVTDGPVEIKVEVCDHTAASWRLEYVDRDGEVASTAAYTGQGDDAVRTVTFRIADLALAGGLPHGMDVRLVCDGPGDATVRWVRLVRLERP